MTGTYFPQFIHCILEAGTAQAPLVLLEDLSTGWKSLEVGRWLLGHLLLRGVECVYKMCVCVCVPESFPNSLPFCPGRG